MLKKTTILLSLIFSITTFSGAIQANNTLPEVELTHWWNHPGELQAVNEIKQAVEQRGAKFVETRIESWDSLRTNILKRISMGYAPAVTQWLSDDYMFSFDQMNAIHPSPSKWRGQSVEEVLFDEVYKGFSTEHGLIGLPIGIHIQNSALFSKAIYQKLHLSPPQSWSEVLAQSTIIQEAGYVPIALSKETWQLQMVLNSILLDEMGAVGYQQFYEKGRPIEQWRASLIRSFDTFLALKQFTDSKARTRGWNEAVSMIGENTAAMHFLGDFAKSELTAKGYKAGEDFLCSLAPGSKGYMVYAIDSFLMFKVDEPLLEEGQRILFDAVLDPEVQAKYTNRKGGIPVRHGVNLEQLDSCAKASYKQWIQESHKTISFTRIGNPLRASFLQSTLGKAWDNDDTNAEQLVNEFLKTDADALKQHKYAN